MDYLRSIEQTQLPFRISDPHGVQCIRVLKAAGLVDAKVSDLPDGESVADLQAITDKGRVALAQYAQGKPFP